MKQIERNFFTLIELLVVVSIIAVLAGILLPALARARSMARSIKCLSNIKQIGGLYAIYSLDNKEHIPSPYTMRNASGSDLYFLSRLTAIYKIPFGKKVENGLFRCPDYPLKGYQDGLFATSYGGNTYGLTGQQSPSADGANQRKMTLFTFPSRTVFIGDNYNHHRVDMEGLAQAPESYTKSTIAFRHNGKASFSFADSHAESRLARNVPCVQGYPSMVSVANLTILKNTFFWYTVVTPTEFQGM